MDNTSTSVSKQRQPLLVQQNGDEGVDGAVVGVVSSSLIDGVGVGIATNTIIINLIHVVVVFLVSVVIVFGCYLKPDKHYLPSNNKNHHHHLNLFVPNIIPSTQPLFVPVLNDADRYASSQLSLFGVVTALSTTKTLISIRRISSTQSNAIKPSQNFLLLLLRLPKHNPKNNNAYIKSVNTIASCSRRSTIRSMMNLLPEQHDHERPITDEQQGYQPEEQPQPQQQNKLLFLSRRDLMVRSSASAAAVAVGTTTTNQRISSSTMSANALDSNAISVAAVRNDVPISSSTSTTTLTTTIPKQKIIIPTAQLGKSSLYVSQTIQGYWQLAGGHGRYQENDAIANMLAHYQVGMTTFDTADIYGPSEIIIGKFIKQYQPTNVIPNTKFCCFRFLEDITRSEVKERIIRSCERLQVSQLPLVQFFWSNYDVKKYIDVGLYLTELKEQGYIREIGATNFDLQRLKEMKKNDIPIVAHQVQLSALDRRPVQSGMADWCYENDISLIGFGTVGSGILSNRWLGKGSPPSAEERNTASMRLYSTTASRFGDWKLVQELLRTMDAIAINIRNEGRCNDCNISNIAQRYVLDGTTSASVSLASSSSSGSSAKKPSSVVASVLIGVRNQDHITENVRTHSFTLKQDEIDTINAIVSKRKGPIGDVWDLERGLI